MAHDIERLIETIVDDISCYGNFGCTLSHVLSIIESFYADNCSQEGSNGDSFEVPAETPSHEALWDWLRMQKKISVGREREWNHLSFYEIHAMPEAATSSGLDNASAENESEVGKLDSSFDSILASPMAREQSTIENGEGLQLRPRIFASEASMWKALAGHTVDFKRIPRLEWNALTGIAISKEDGILQSDLCRLVGQDKRSLPRRTDSLAQKGYIVKRITLARGVKTSKMWLRRLAPKLPSDPGTKESGNAGPSLESTTLSDESLNRDMEPVAWRSRWTGQTIDTQSLADTTIAIVKAYGIIRYHDLRRKLGILTMPWQMKVTARMCRWMVRKGIIQYVGATLGDRLFKDCLKYIRDLTENDLAEYLRTGKVKSEPKADTNLDDYRGGAQKSRSSEQQKKTAISNSILLRASWKPEKPLSFFVLDAIRSGNPRGVTNRQVGSHTMGPPFSRYVTSVTSTLATPSLQPKHLSHFQVHRELHRLKKQAAYSFRIPGIKRTTEIHHDQPSSLNNSAGSLPPSAGESIGSYFSCLMLDQTQNTTTYLNAISQTTTERKHWKASTAATKAVPPGQEDANGTNPEHSTVDILPPAEIQYAQGLAESMLLQNEPPTPSGKITVQRCSLDDRRNTSSPTLVTTFHVSPHSLSRILSQRGVIPPTGEQGQHGVNNRLETARERPEKAPPEALPTTISGQDAQAGSGPAQTVSDNHLDILELHTAQELLPYPNDKVKTSAMDSNEAKASTAAAYEPDLVNDQPPSTPTAPAKTPGKRGRPANTTGKAGKKTTKGSKASSFQCDKCGRVWKNNNGLKYHLEKSSAACNTSYVPPPKPSISRALASFEQGSLEVGSCLETPSRLTRTVTERLSTTKRETAAKRYSHRLGVSHSSPLRPRSMPKMQVSLTRNFSPGGPEIQQLGETRSVEEQEENTPALSLVSHDIWSRDAPAGGVIQPVPGGIRGVPHELFQATKDGGLRGALSMAPEDLTRGVPIGDSIEEPGNSEKKDQDALEQHGPTVSRQAIDRKAYTTNNEEHEATGTATKPSSPVKGRHAQDSATGKARYQSTLGTENSVGPSSQMEAFQLPDDSAQPTLLGYRHNSTAYRVAEIILYLIRVNGGVFPTGRALWYGIYSVWEKTFASDYPPNHGSCQFVVAKLAEKKKLQKSTHAFRDRKGIFKYATMLLSPGVDPSCSAAVALKDCIIAAYPRPYVPPGFMPESGMPDENTWNGKPIFSGRRKLANQIEVLDAPFYANRKATQRTGRTLGTHNQGPRKRRNHKQLQSTGSSRPIQGSDHGHTESGMFRHIVGGHGAGEASSLNGSIVWPSTSTPPLPQPSHHSAPFSLTFLEPNTRLDGEPELENSVQGTDASLDVSPTSESKLTSLDSLAQSSAARYAETIIISESDGAWPCLGSSFFEQERSFALRGWLPDNLWHLNRGLPQNLNEIMVMRGQPAHSSHTESPHEAFLEQVNSCEKWECLPEAKQLVRLGTVAPDYIWINHEMKTSVPWARTELTWIDEMHLTPERYRWAITLQRREEEAQCRLQQHQERLTQQDLTRQKRSAPVQADRPPKRQRRESEELPVLMDLKSRTMTPWKRPATSNSASQLKRGLDGSNEFILIAGFVATRTLLGGADKHIEWGLMMRLFPDRPLAYLRRFWSKARKDRAGSITQLTEQFQKKFIIAYERGEFPPIDFDNYLEYDWVELVGWTARLVGDETVLPATVDDLQRYWLLETTQADLHNWQERYYSAQSSMFNRLEALTSKSATTPADRDTEDAKTGDSELVRAMSWVRALCGTTPGRYASEDVRKKMVSVTDRGETESNALVDRAIQILQAGSVITRSRYKQGKPSLYRFTEWFLPRLAKMSQAEKYREAAGFKFTLDCTFRRGDVYRVPYVLRDGEVMAMINMQAGGRINVSPVDIPNIPLGFKPGFYESRKFPKSYYNFGLEVTPTETYIFDEDLSLLARATTETPPVDRAQGILPLWSDIFGQFNGVRWAQVLGAMVFAIAIRGPLNIQAILSAMKPFLEDFEVRLAVDWATRNQIIKVSGQSAHYTAHEWWWLVVGRLMGPAGKAGGEKPAGGV